jgi:hypothetical protein
MKLHRTDPELETLISRLREKEIDLQPDFQRGDVWNLARQQRLVDTILRDWYIPPVHLISDPDSGRELVLDGQQRLSAIRSFFDNEFPVNGRFDPVDPELTDVHGLCYSELPPEMRRRVRRFSLTVITLTDYRPEEPFELFFRLNQHMTLTPPEKRNALYGAARDQVKELISGLGEDLLNKETVGFANRRLAYDDVFARFTLAIEQHTLRTNFSNSAIEDFYRHKRFKQDTMERADSAARSFLELSHEVKPKLNKATLFSWLVFTFGAEELGESNTPRFLDLFEQTRSLLAPHARRPEGSVTPPLSEDLPEGALSVVSVYNNRASYRVNDTLSILLRDLALHTVASLLRERSSDGLEGLVSEMRFAGSNGQTESVMVGFVETSEWDLPSGTPR